MSEVSVTPKVRAQAARYRINLAAIKGTGAGGRISLADVNRVAAGMVTEASPSTMPARPPAGRGTAWAANPLLDVARSRKPGRAVNASAKTPPPTLFPSGDLPAFTASGVDPKALMAAPWQARHAIAAAPTTAEAYRLLDDYSGPEGAVAAELEQGHHPGTHFYTEQMRLWLANAATEDETYAALFPDK